MENINKFKPVTRESHERVDGITSPKDILNQLDVSERKYQDILADFEEGRVPDIEYLQQMDRNLVDFKNMFIQKFGTTTPENLEISNRITERLFKLREIHNAAGSSH